MNINQAKTIYEFIEKYKYLENKLRIIEYALSKDGTSLQLKFFDTVIYGTKKSEQLVEEEIPCDSGIIQAIKKYYNDKMLEIQSQIEALSEN